MRLTFHGGGLMGLPTSYTPMRHLAGEEITALVQGYTDEQLARNYRVASEQPGTEWHRLLSEEIGRRDALGPQR